MGLPKRKNDIEIYKENTLLNRRYELLHKIKKSDTYLPESIFSDDLDLGFLNFVKENFQIEIPIIPKILTTQRWGEVANTWTFSDNSSVIKVPFISVIRKPNIQPGSNPITIRTIPERKPFYYNIIQSTSEKSGEIFKIPQPIAVDITYDVIIVTQKLRDLDKLNKIVLTKFASRQAYTVVKGHYIPIILNNINDNTNNNVDSRKFYLQTYEFTLLGFLIDENEFEVKPLVNKAFLFTNILEEKKYTKKTLTKKVRVNSVKFIGNGTTVSFNVEEKIKFLYYVTINGLTQQEGVNFYHISGTSKITFSEPPLLNDIIYITYTPSANTQYIGISGNVLELKKEYFTYDGTSLTFETNNQIYDIIYLEINGLIDEEGLNYSYDGNLVTLLSEPLLGSTIGVTYFI